MPTKYTKELLEPLVRSSTSFSEVVLKLGFTVSGGRYCYTKRSIVQLGLDTTHFTGRSSNRGVSHKGGPEKLTPDQVLVLDRNNRRKEGRDKLKRALLESGVREICSECGLPPVWNQKPIVLQIDHINGCPIDNRKENLRFLCPNCHTQTDNFGGRKKAP